MQNLAISIVVFFSSAALAIIPAYLVYGVYAATEDENTDVITVGVFVVLFVLCLFILDSWARKLRSAG